jgi:hypothetical protein
MDDAREERIRISPTRAYFVLGAIPLLAATIIMYGAARSEAIAPVLIALVLCAMPGAILIGIPLVWKWEANADLIRVTSVRGKAEWAWTDFSELRTVQTGGKVLSLELRGPTDRRPRMLRANTLLLTQKDLARLTAFAKEKFTSANPRQTAKQSKLGIPR